MEKSKTKPKSHTKSVVIAGAWLLGAVFMFSGNGRGDRHSAGVRSMSIDSPKSQSYLRNFRELVLQEKNTCEVKLIGGKTFQKVETGEVGCADDEVCIPNDYVAAESGDAVSGTCQEQKCYGRANEDLEDDIDSHLDRTTRVTICHRSCDENNPWVRLTIDESAFLDGCTHHGHSLSTCGKDQASWGKNPSDYILKNHATPEKVRSDNGWGLTKEGKRSTEEKDFWRVWERACPAVRDPKGANACCGTLETGPCCGDDLYPGINAGIRLDKTVKLGNHASCDGKEEYEILQAELGDEVTFCYKVTNIGDTDACNIQVIDSIKEFTVETDDSCISPGTSVYLPPNVVTVCGTVPYTTACARARAHDINGAIEELADLADDDEAKVDLVECVPKPKLPGFAKKPYVCAAGVYPSWCANPGQ